MDIEENIQQESTTEVSEPASGMSDRARIVSLAIGDALVFLIFSYVGRSSHNEAVGLNAIGQVIWTALPFAAGWFIIAPFMKAYRRGLEIQPGKMAQRTALAWLASWPVCLLIRGVIEGSAPPLTFALITLATNMVFLLIWRVPFALINSVRQRKKV